MTEIAEARSLTFAQLENLFARLPGDFYTKMPAEKVGEKPRLVHANAKAAALIGLDPGVFPDPAFVGIFSGHTPFPGGAAAGDGLFRASVRRLGRAIGRWPRASDRAGPQSRKANCGTCS